jgi:hypothetical protein
LPTSRAQERSTPRTAGRARHILDATDRLKFAREGGGTGFFEALDDDFTAVLDATRPRVEEPANA